MHWETVSTLTLTFSQAFSPPRLSWNTIIILLTYMTLFHCKFLNNKTVVQDEIKAGQRKLAIGLYVNA